MNIVFHCAARAHILKETSEEPISAFRRVNVLGTRRLAEQAVQAGVKRFVFISSIGVHGITTDGRQPFSIHDAPAPAKPYGQSKLEAEGVLRDIASQTGLETVIVRPPLVYGPGVRANFLRLIRLIRSRVPLPFARLNNRRSYVFLDNLVDLLIQCSEHAGAAGGTFLVSDDEDLSTPDLVGRLGEGMGVKARMLPASVNTLRILGHMTGRLAEVESLTTSLQVDIRHTVDSLGWHPSVSVDEGIRRTVACLD
jgi:nucleoside-diphosphate-sugar epimerase